ncbi:iron chelate uptake ABC transporter family permease subunit [Mycolicibacterium goodii]|uniref:iron chelate uptake ABC transporter family permease subunit n=1 Tax=Mycolicibacterium goodii TaxID=134601 RepID=UPI001BDC5EAF|nr:iron chelate uptake ABC transporter family permease subunit [Mycolicibacterium goodii]MBU8829757.1 iron chelate uptake ABC transporter family permease subunit [Mycolicibacterium goodii]
MSPPITRRPSGATSSPGVGLTGTRTLRMLGLILFVVVLAGIAAASVAVGARPIPFSTVVDAFAAFDGSNEHQIVRDLRIPRTAAGLLVGAALGASGALIQALTRNPLADPGLLGVNAGAALSVAIGIAVFGVGSVSGYLWFAFAGALVATLGVYGIGAAATGAVDPVRLTLAGVAMGAVLMGVTSALMLLQPRTFDHMRGWNAGTLAARGPDVLLPTAPFVALGLTLALVAARSLNGIALGDDLAASLGVSVHRTRAVVIVAVTFLAGTATAIAGPIAFVGLMIPHIARWIVGPDQRWILAYTIVLAPILLLLADGIGRVATSPGEVPVGIVTAFVGAPVLILLIRNRRAIGL